MKKAKLKILFRIPFTIYFLAVAIYPYKKLLCLATKEFDDGKYWFYEITLNEDIDCTPS